MYNSISLTQNEKDLYAFINCISNKWIKPSAIFKTSSLSKDFSSFLA